MKPLTPADVELARRFAGEMDSQSDLTEHAGQAATERDEFFDGGWCWMAHPSRNIGNPIPVFMYAAQGVRYYVPLDPSEGGELVWDERDDEWEIVAPWDAETSDDFALFAAKAAGGHLSALVDELRAELASLRASRDALVKALEATLCAMERARSNMQYAISDKPVRDAAETYGECAYAEQIARAALTAAKETTK